MEVLGHPNNLGCNSEIHPKGKLKDDRFKKVNGI